MQGDGIDTAALGAFLAGRITGFGTLSRMQQFATGQSNPTYRLTTDTGDYVLRAKPAGPLLPSAHLVAREYRVMQALADTAVPVPRMVLNVDDAANPLGRGFYVMEHLTGRILWDPALPDQTPAERAAIYAAMNATLVALHSADPAAIGLSDFGKPANYLARQTDRWHRQYSASIDTPHPVMQHLHRWLQTHMPADAPATLTHGDYRLDNMMFAPDAPRVIGLLDWELATLGDPMCDLAYQCLQWRMPHDSDTMQGLAGVDRAGLGLPSEEGYVASYCAARGVAIPDNWLFYLAFSTFRLTAILQGVVHRATHGTAANPGSGARYGACIRPLLAIATDLIGPP